MMILNPMEIHRRLRTARLQAGYLRAVHAASAMGVNNQTYASHENGNRGIGRDAAIAYARHFNVGLDWLLTGQGSPESAKNQAIDPHQSDDPAPGIGTPYDPEIFKQAAAMVEEFKLDMGFKFVSTPDYLQLIETFYEQAQAEQVNEQA